MITDIVGFSGRRMIEAMTKGVINPLKLAELAHRRIKASRKQLYDGLHGRLTDHHRLMLRLHLQQYDATADAIAEIDAQVAASIAKVDAEVAAGPATFHDLIVLLCTIPGIGELAGKTILAEIGTDMSRFPSAGHLLARVVSGAERKCRQAQVLAPAQRVPVAQELKTLMVQCGWAASRKKDSYYKAEFNRLRGRLGAKRAICAVAASILTPIYHMRKNGTEHQDLGADHFGRRSTTIKAARLASEDQKARLRG